MGEAKRRKMLDPNYGKPCCNYKLWHFNDAPKEYQKNLLYLFLSDDPGSSLSNWILQIKHPSGDTIVGAAYATLAKRSMDIRVGFMWTTEGDNLSAEEVKSFVRPLVRNLRKTVAAKVKAAIEQAQCLIVQEGM